MLLLLFCWCCVAVSSWMFYFAIAPNEKDSMIKVQVCLYLFACIHLYVCKYMGLLHSCIRAYVHNMHEKLVLAGCIRMYVHMHLDKYYVTKSDKTGLIALFCISRNTDLKHWMHCTYFSGGAIQSCQMCCGNSVLI